MIFHVLYLFLAISYGVTAEQSKLHKKYDDDEDGDEPQNMRDDGDDGDEPQTMGDGDDGDGDADTNAAGDEGDDDIDADSFMQIHDFDKDLSPEVLEKMSPESLLELHDRLQEHVDNTAVLDAVLSSFAELTDDSTDEGESDDAHFDKWYNSVMSKLHDLEPHTDKFSLMEKVAGASKWAAKHVVGSDADPSLDSLLEDKGSAYKIAAMEKHYDEDFNKAFTGALSKAMKNTPTVEARPHSDSLLQTDGKKNANDPFAKLKAQEDEVGREMNQVFNPDNLAASFADTASVAVGADGKTEQLNLRTDK